MLEAASCRRASAILLVSEAEAELFRRTCPNDHTYGVPNGVDLDYFHPLPGEGRPGRCVFVGALDYRANIDGICWFCRDVWPRIRAREPNATLAIVGRNPVPEVKRLSAVAGVEVFGSVPDVRPYLADASVVVAPLRIARGIQNKILEAMACCRPVVASPEALEGLDAKSGIHAAAATTPTQWCDQIVHLLTSPYDRSLLAIASRDYVERHHDWQICLGPCGELLNLPRETTPDSQVAEIDRLPIAK
jgi:sugar transferase (PEP-CTERM/EpsH1 system associated)